MNTEFRGSKYRAIWLEARQMPLSTLLFRLRWEAAKWLGLHKGRYEPSRLSNDDVLDMFPLVRPSPAALLEHVRTRKSVRFFFDRRDLPNIRRIWRDRLPAARGRLVAEAERICRHEFSFLGSPVNTFDGDIDWHNEMAGHGRWPLRHWSEIDVRSEARLGDVKLTWELNRTQFFVTLGRAYALTGDDRYVRELCSMLRSWIDQNPSETGVNWYSNLECALRATSWLFALEMTLDWPDWDADLFVDVVRCLIDHHHHIYKDIALSESEPVSNHLIGDAMGIALLALYFPELDHSARYRERAVDLMCRESRVWFRPDGGGIESAVSYHRFVYYMYVLTGIMLERNGMRMPGAVWESMERLCEFVTQMRTPSGRIWQIGDWDGGRAVILDESDLADFGSMLTTASVRFDRGDLRAVAGEPGEEALWLLGPEAVRKHDDTLARPSAVLDAAYFDSGLFFWRSDWSSTAEYVGFKCSPFYWHTHADNLSVVYSSRGRDWLVDRGTYTYNGDWRWRTYFRGTQAHNAVVVDRGGQAIAHRAFRWLRPPVRAVYKYSANRTFGYAAASIAGFGHLRRPMRHSRCLLLARDRYVLIVDVMNAKGAHEYELLWHVAPEHAIRVDRDGLVCTDDPDGPNFWLRTIGSVRPQTRLAIGETDPIQGWHSCRYGHKTPAPTIIQSAAAVGPICLATVVGAVEPGKDIPRIHLEFESPFSSGSDSLRIRLGVGQSVDRICLPNPYGLTHRHSPTGQLWVERSGEMIPIL